MLKSVFLMLAVLIIAASATNVRKCNKGQPDPLDVDIVGCTKMPCDVVKGSTMIMYVHLLGVKPVTNELTAKVRATTGFVTVPYELPADIADVCSNLIDGAECPIYQSEDVVYQFNFNIDEWYPEIAVKVELTLEDEDGTASACFVTDIKVRK